MLHRDLIFNSKEYVQFTLGTETSLYECPNVANKVLLAAPGTCDPVENGNASIFLLKIINKI